jgi:hypothetical protein
MRSTSYRRTCSCLRMGCRSSCRIRSSRLQRIWPAHRRRRLQQASLHLHPWAWACRRCQRRSHRLRLAARLPPALRCPHLRTREPLRPQELHPWQPPRLRLAGSIHQRQSRELRPFAPASPLQCRSAQVHLRQPEAHRARLLTPRNESRRPRNLPATEPRSPLPFSPSPKLTLLVPEAQRRHPASPTATQCNRPKIGVSELCLLCGRVGCVTRHNARGACASSRQKVPKVSNPTTRPNTSHLTRERETRTRKTTRCLHFSLLRFRPPHP